MRANHKPSPLHALLAAPRTFVARLIVADLIAKRGEGPLARQVPTYKRGRR
jgi:hypothetical protein